MQTIALFALNLELGTNSSLFILHSSFFTLRPLLFVLHSSLFTSLPAILRAASMRSLSSRTTM